jgi:ERCC4-type nuclease
MTIIIDTREQTPLVPAVFRSPGKVRIESKWSALPAQWITLPTKRAALPAGDYSVEGLEHVVAIERKSVSDLAGTLYGSATNAAGERAGHLERFRRELERLQPYARKWWLIEGSPEDFEGVILQRFRHIQPTAAFSLIASIACDYNIPTEWAGNRLRAAHFVGVTLGRIAAQHKDPKEARKARTRNLELPWLAPEEACAHAKRAKEGLDP